MGLKAITNSRNGRAALMLIALCTIGFALCGGLLWYLVYEPQSSSSGAEARALELAPNYAIGDVEIIYEENQLDGLPSSTLVYRDLSANRSGSNSPGGAILFPVAALSGKLESIINVRTYFQTKATGSKKKADYNFEFYASGLGDYNDGGAYTRAAAQFTSAYESASKVVYSSAPTPSGGRVVDMTVTARSSFTERENIVARDSWKKLVEGVVGASDLNGTIINLTLVDPSGQVTIAATLTSEEDVEAALTIPERMWPTFSGILNSASMNFLEAQKLTYRVERTVQDSTLTIQVDESLKEVEGLRLKLWKAGIGSHEDINIPGSYIIYLTTAEDPTPFLASYSTSRNW